ncbi:MAG: dTDP-4-dehydrorhamnose reductase [Candidatus Moranbacteria bacterium]|nr:dTDP-4-dehydrorhamnose reductase [Candidatus Moranbacteria bacterium]
MKILIIGHKGNLGTQLMEVFSQWEPIGWDLEQIDITDEKQVKNKLRKLRPDFVINASAYNAVDKCEEKQGYELARKVNGFGPGYLAKVCEKIGADLVHYSSDYVFDGEKIEGYKEDDTPNPIQNYGRTKLLGENQILANTQKYFIIRVSKLFGPPGKSEAAKKSFVDIMFDLAKKESTIRVVDEEVSCFTYTKDLALATRNLLGISERLEFSNYHLNNPNELYVDKKPYGIYHIVNEGPCTWYECAKRLFEMAKEEVNLIPVTKDEFPRPAKRPQYSVLLNTRLSRLRRWDKAAAEYLTG